MLPLRLALVAVLFAGQFIVPRPPAAFSGSDQFTAAIDTANWAILSRQGDLSNSEVQCYTSAQQTVTGGELLITAQVVGSHVCSGNSYTRDSAMIQWKTFNFTYGTLTARAKMTGGAGPWPTIWLLGHNCQDTNVVSADNSGACVWPNAGSDEIDFVEQLSSDTAHINQQIHSGANNGGCTAAVTDTTVYHVYQMIWAAGDLVWKVDGVQTCHVTVGVPSTAMFLIVNVALGGAGGAVTNGTLPQTMTVDYVTLSQP